MKVGSDLDMQDRPITRAAQASWLAACLLQAPLWAAPGPQPAPAAPPVVTTNGELRLAPPVPLPMAMAMDSLCMVEPSAEVNVGTPVDGVLEAVLADRGDMVKSGQVLARLSSGVEQAAVDLQAAKAEFGARKRARNEELRRKELLSQQELDELNTELLVAELELKERQEQLKLRAVMSPVNGVIVDRYRQRGDLVKQERIFRVAQLDPLHVEAVVPAARFGRILAGQTYDVQLQLAGGRVKAQVSQVDRVIDAASGTFRVRLVLPNPKFQIPPGQRCQVSFAAPRPAAP